MGFKQDLLRVEIDNWPMKCFVFVKAHLSNSKSTKQPEIIRQKHLKFFFTMILTIAVQYMAEVLMVFKTTGEKESHIYF